MGSYLIHLSKDAASGRETKHHALQTSKDEEVRVGLQCFGVDSINEAHCRKPHSFFHLATLQAGRTGSPVFQLEMI